MNFLIEQLPGFLVGVVSGFVSSFLVQHYGQHRAKKNQIRNVSADFHEEWQPLSGNERVLSSVSFRIHNASQWEVTEVMVLHPAWIHMPNLPLLRANDARTIELDLQTYMKESLGGLETITLQLLDVRGKCWKWTPQKKLLEPIPPRIPVHARVVQQVIRWTPDSFQQRFLQLPKPLLTFLWGYDPAG